MRYRFRSQHELTVFADDMAQALAPDFTPADIRQRLAAAAGVAPEALVQPECRHQVFPDYPRTLELDQFDRHAQKVLRPLIQTLRADKRYNLEKDQRLHKAYLTATVESALPEAVVAVRRKGYLESFSLAQEMILWAEQMTALPTDELSPGMMQVILRHLGADEQPFPLPGFVFNAEMPAQYRSLAITTCARAVVDLEGAVGCTLAIPCRLDETDAIVFVEKVTHGGGLFLSVNLGPRAIEAYVPLEDSGEWGSLEYLSDIETPTLDVLGLYSGVPPRLQPKSGHLPTRIDLTPDQSEDLVTRARAALARSGYRVSAALLRSAFARVTGTASATEQASQDLTTELSLGDLEYLERDALLNQLVDEVRYALQKRFGRLPEEATSKLYEALEPVLGFAEPQTHPLVQSFLNAPTDSRPAARLH